jgi:hypothetical protein
MSTEVVYGQFRGNDLLVFIPKWRADELAATWKVLHTPSTWGELEAGLTADRFEEAARQVWDDEEPPADAPFSITDLNSVAEGDWPVRPAQEQMGWMPESAQRLGEVIYTSISGEHLDLGLETEAAVVAALTAEGHTVRRDDAAVEATYQYDGPGS